MREFLLLMNRTRTDSNFSVENLSENGRIDIGCRFINSTLFNSYSLRRDVVTHLLLRGPPKPPLHIEIDGRNVRGLHPDERSIAGYIKKNIKSFEDRNVSANIGVAVRREGLEDFLDSRRAKPVLLHESGDDISDIELPDEPVFILGDHKGVSHEDVEIIDKYDSTKISLGETPYQAQQVSSFLNIFMDRRP